MQQLTNYLSSLEGDVFKLLPMKEDEMAGVNNHVTEYVESLVINLTGAMATYPELSAQKQYLYVLNSIQYIKNHEVSFEKWRKIILKSTRNINDLCALFGGGVYDK